MKHRTGWLAMTGLALLLAAASTRYFSLNPAFFRPAYLANAGSLLLHAGFGSLALAAGPWQFLPGLRSRRPRLHRALGRVYLVSVLGTGVGGLLLARIAQGGPVAQAGFAVLALEVLAATLVAFVAILRRRIRAHRQWMIRSYALIFSAVTFRLLLVPAFLGLPFDAVYAADAWVAPVVNLLIAQALIARKPAGRLSPRPVARPEPEAA